MEAYPETLGYSIRIGECLLRSGQVRLAARDYSGAATDFHRAIALYEELPWRGGEPEMFLAGCHAMLSRLSLRHGSAHPGVPASEKSVEAAENAMAILRRIMAGMDTMIMYSTLSRPPSAPSVTARTSSS